MYTPDLEKLVELAGLKSEFAKKVATEPLFEANWATVKDWSPESRYSIWTQRQAKDIYSAIASRKYGTLQWIRQHW